MASSLPGSSFRSLQRFLEDGVDDPALALAKADDQGLEFAVEPVLVHILSTAPEMIRGVRASSIRIESTSSTMA